ncbi:MAG TPA: ABC transporter ATP-binding protein [Stellaceae bacterium]|nr:ABC transporter ATP-binding protein [Stellaceae bacterium]
MLAVSGLETAYGASRILFGVDLTVGAGEVVTLLGRNGMGKTTVVKSILGLTPIRAGTILFEGRPIHGMPTYRIARAGIGLVPEGRHVFPNLTVSENLVATAAQRGGAGAAWRYEDILMLFPNLAERTETYGSRLSGGEQQMLAIGRALLTNPRLLILDEATEGLAPLIRAEIWRCLETLKARGLAILVIDKNLAALTRLADRHYVIEKGRIVWHGDSAALRADEAVRRRYLGV